MNQFRAILIVAVGCMALTVASCKKSGGTVAAKGKPVASVQTEGVSCDIVSSAEVGSILGISDLGPAQSRWNSYDKARTCDYLQPNNPTAVTITYRMETSLRQFDLDRHTIDSMYRAMYVGSTSQDVAGIGEKAFVLSFSWKIAKATIQTTTLYVLKGSVWFAIITTKSTLEKEKQLASLILSRL